MAKTRKSKKIRRRGFLDLFKKMNDGSKLKKYKGGGKAGFDNFGFSLGSETDFKKFMNSIPTTDVYYPFLSAYYKKIYDIEYGDKIFPSEGDNVGNFYIQLYDALGIRTDTFPSSKDLSQTYAFGFLYLYPDLQEIVSGGSSGPLVPADPQPSSENYDDLMKVVSVKNKILSIPPMDLSGYYDMNGYYFAIMAATKYQLPLIADANSNMPINYQLPPIADANSNTPTYSTGPLSETISEAKAKIVKKAVDYNTARDVFVRLKCPVIGVECGPLSGVCDMLTTSIPNFERAANDYADQAASQYPNDIKKQIALLDNQTYYSNSFKTDMDPSLIPVVLSHANNMGYGNGSNPNMLRIALSEAFDGMQQYSNVSDQIKFLQGLTEYPLMTNTEPLTTTTEPLTTTTEPLITTTRHLTTTTKPSATTTKPSATTTKPSATTTKPSATTTQTISDYHETISHYHETFSDYHETISDYHETISDYHETIRHYHETFSDYHETISHYHETFSHYHEASNDD